MIERKTVDIGWGREPLTDQLKGMCDPHDAEHFELDAAAFMRLRIRGYITDSQRDGITKKLFKSIGDAVKKHSAALNQGGDGVERDRAREEGEK